MRSKATRCVSSVDCAMRVRYDTIHARAGLAGTGIRVPALRDYFAQLMDFAVAADWGNSEGASSRQPDRLDMSVR